MRRRGFTLIELLVVISIIALLLSIMMPALTKVKEAARRTICQTRVKGLTTAIFAYAVKYNDNIPSSNHRRNASRNNRVYAWNPVYGVPPYAGWNGLGLLYTEKLVEAGEAFYCPSQKHPSLKPELYFPAKTFSGQNGKLPKNFNPGGCIALGSISYGLTGQVDDCIEAHRSELEMQELKLQKLKDRPLATDIFIPLDYGGDVWKSSFAHSGKKGGLNVGFADGHVEFVKLTQSVFHVANKQNTKHGLHHADLFAATMMKLLVGQPKYMEYYFDSEKDPGDPPFDIIK